ncbi:WG repeat-containing protein [Chryseobacterium sp. ISL-6]|nr:WG repeat-containing protein [Chryseobacterium sp. ISL-6]
MSKMPFLLLLLPIISFSQKKDVLTYFKSKDSLVGVKDQNGKIIIPAQFKVFSILEDGEQVKEETIYFDGPKEGEAREKNAWGYVYDKKGNFLYRPFFYDNGADYFAEGVRRFVKNGKVGFADRNGKAIIEAKHDFVSPFNYGYAAFCDGCDWEKTEDEHKAIVGGTWGVMNFKGEIVQSRTKLSENDVEVNGVFYPYPFEYNEKERNILQFFKKQNKMLSSIYYVNLYNKLSNDEKKLFFEITERPKENFPFFKVESYDYRKMETDFRFKFIISEDGKQFYALDYDVEKLPFDKWLKKEMKEAEEYQKEHPDNPNKFINNNNP